MADLSDNCPFTANPIQSDIGSALDDAGAREIFDVTVIQRALEPVPLLPGIEQVCSAATGP